MQMPACWGMPPIWLVTATPWTMRGTAAALSEAATFLVEAGAKDKRESRANIGDLGKIRDGGMTRGT
jgi:hypothetical protein